LYEYIALDAGQWFVGELSCANDDCWRRLCELTGVAAGQTLRLRLGKASRRGYGLATFFLQQVSDSEPITWALRPLTDRVTKADEPFSMLLLSDAIVADEWGRYEGGFAPEWLARLLKVREDEIELLGRFASARVIDTFNAARRAPRWRDEAIVAGSAVGIRVLPSGLTRLIEFWRQSDGQSAANTPDALMALRWRLGQIEAEGIGRRTNEGFGRVAFNHPVYTQDGGDDLERGVSVDRRVAGFTAVSGQDDLVRESLFRRKWVADLARWEDEAKPKEKSKGGSARSNSENWRELAKPPFEPVARLLYLSCREDAAAIIKRLESLSNEEAMKNLPSYLWGKKLPERGQGPKLSKEGGVELLRELVTELQQQVPDPADPRWAIGLKLLAARVAELARKEKR
jgi:CRISPR-associated protein Csx10